MTFPYPPEPAATAANPFVKSADMQAYAQPIDADLAAIAALTTATYGRSLLTLANQAALQSAIHQWVGKKVSCLGTSITALSQWTTPFAAKGVTLTNLAVNSSSLSTSAGVGAGWIFNQIYGLGLDADLIIIDAGINDFRSDATLGAIGDTTLATFYGGLWVLIREIYIINPVATIVFLLPYGNTDAGYVGNWKTNNNNGNSLQQFRQAVIEVTRMTGVSYVDLAESGVGGRTAGTYLVDGIHPNADGGVRIAECIWNNLTRMEPPTVATPTNGWRMIGATQANLSFMNCTADVVDGTIYNAALSGGSYGVVWPATGSRNAVEWSNTTSIWGFFGQGSSGAVGIGDGTGAFSVLGKVATTGTIVTSAVSITGTATRYRLARILNLLYMDKYVNEAWVSVLNGVDLTTLGTVTGYYETVKVGFIIGTGGTITGVKTGTYS